MIGNCSVVTRMIVQVPRHQVQVGLVSCLHEVNFKGTGKALFLHLAFTTLPFKMLYLLTFTLAPVLVVPYTRGIIPLAEA